MVPSIGQIINVTVVFRLVTYMCSGPCQTLILAKPNAIQVCFLLDLALLPSSARF